MHGVIKVGVSEIKYQN